MNDVSSGVLDLMVFTIYNIQKEKEVNLEPNARIILVEMFTQ